MRIREHLSEDFIDKLYTKVIKGMKNKHQINQDEKKETERMMGKYTKTLRRGRGGAWK